MTTSVNLNNGIPETAAQNQLRDIVAALRTAEAAMTADQPVTLTTIVANIEQFCAAVPHLPPPLARRLLPEIEAIMVKLENLETQLQERHGNLSSDNGATRLRAQAAYHRRRD